MTITTYKMLKATLSAIVLLNLSLHVYSMDNGEEFFRAEHFNEDSNFLKVLEMAQHDNKAAAHVMKVKKSLESHGKSIPHAVYRRMKIKVLKSLKEDYLRRRTLMNEAVMYPHVQCGLWKIPVEIPYLKNTYNYPAFIELHRCIGGCEYHSPSLIHCAATKQHTIKASHLQADLTNVKFTMVVSTMLNHTECNCQCIVQKHHCNHTLEYYDSGDCSCKCKNIRCDNPRKERDSNCQCQCKKELFTCTSPKNQWNPETCDCECSSSDAVRCIKSNKIFDLNTCECKCPPDIKCAPGLTLDTRDCSCNNIF